MRKVAALAIVGLLACSGPLADAKVVTGNDRGLDAVSVDKQRPIALTVQKKGPNPNDEVPEGQLPPGPIEGAKFELAKVKDIDVTSAEGRERAKTMDLKGARALGFEAPLVAVTNAQGHAYFQDLRAGLYLLREQHREDGKHEFHVTEPKLVLLPLGDVTGESFSYDNVVVTKDGYGKPSEPGDPSETSTTSTTPKSPGDSLTTTPTTTPRLTTTRTTTERTTTERTTRVTTTAPTTYVTTTRGTVTTVTTTPGVPNWPSDGGGGSRVGEALASTGANVLWAAGIGALLIVLGIVLARRRNEEDA